MYDQRVVTGKFSIYIILMNIVQFLFCQIICREKFRPVEVACKSQPKSNMLENIIS